jgi:hypothetical protein
MRCTSAAAAAFIFAAAASGAATADDGGFAAWVNEVKVGVLYHDMDDLWSNFRLESGVDFNGELIFAPHVAFLGGAFRPAIGASINSAGDTSKLYAGVRYQYELDGGLFFSVGGGGAVHDGHLTPGSGDRKALGSRLLFHIPLEAGYRFDNRHALSVYFDHVSNAFLAGYNEGLDTLGMRYGYRFLTAAPGR